MPTVDFDTSSGRSEPSLCNSIRILQIVAMAGYTGRLRRGTLAIDLKPESKRHAWKHKCTFKRDDQDICWIVMLKDPFRMGCYVCNSQNMNSAWANFQVKVDSLSTQNVLQHAGGKKHRRALEQLLAGGEGAPSVEVSDPDFQIPEKTEDAGAISTLNADVPRMDRWMAAVTLLCERVGYSQQAQKVESSEVGTVFKPAGQGDSSKTVVKKMFQCLACNLQKVDFERIRSCAAASIAIDKGGLDLVVYGRFLGPYGMYECLLGVERPNEVLDATAGEMQALENVLRRACTVRDTGRRSNTNIYEGDRDHVDKKVLHHLRKAILTAVADGGPTEQRCLFESSSAGPALRDEPTYDPLMPNLRLITRDAAHRYHSIDKLFWKKLPSFFQDTLKKLVDGERSVSRLLETSPKFQALFWDCQRNHAEREDAMRFGAFLKSFAYAEQRWDSKKKPLFRLFRLWPVLCEALERVCSATSTFQASDIQFSRALLQEWSGDSGYVKLVGCAVISDAMLMASPFLRLADKDAADYSLSGTQAAECITLLRSMLWDGGIWLPEAKDTVTHSVLKDIKSKVLFMDRGSGNSQAVIVRWPAPGSAARKEPVRLARKSPGQKRSVLSASRRLLLCTAMNMS